LPEEAGRGGKGRRTGARQRGHEAVDLSHVSMHSAWNACRQAGKRRSSALGSNGERQTAQSGDDLGRDAKEDARVNIGSASINASVLL
jgi:hypothetical protein